MIDKDASNESLTTSAQRCDECGAYIGAVSYFWVKGRTLCISCYLKTPSSKEEAKKMNDGVEWYESEAVDKIDDFVFDCDYLDPKIIDHSMEQSEDFEEFRESLCLNIDTAINGLERLRELVRALE